MIGIHQNDNGEWIHFYEDEDGNALDPVLDENNKHIPASICICHAHGKSECFCGAWDQEFEFTDNLLPCPMCNSPVEMDSGAASEYGGKDWQTMQISCTKCDMYVRMNADYWYFRDAWNEMRSFWNKVASRKL